MKMELIQSSGEAETRIAVSGAMDASGVAITGMELENMAGACSTSLVFDIKRVSLLDPSGIGLLVALYKRLAARGLKLRLAEARGQPEQLLRQLRLDGPFELGTARADSTPNLASASGIPMATPQLNAA